MSYSIDECDVIRAIATERLLAGAGWRPPRALDWTESLYGEDICDESWARLARSIGGSNPRSVLSKRGNGRRNEHIVAKRAR